MKDLYRQLRIDENAPEEKIRESLPMADASTREAAAFVLLDPRRRQAYDRHRRLLISIGQLRAHLGLNLTPFWARGDFKDFHQELAPPPEERIRKRRVDAMMIAQAFQAAGRHGRHHATRWKSWVVGVAAAGVIAIAIVVWRHWFAFSGGHP